MYFLNYTDLCENVDTHTNANANNNYQTTSQQGWIKLHPSGNSLSYPIVWTGLQATYVVVIRNVLQKATNQVFL